MFLMRLVCINLTKRSGKYYCDKTQREDEKCRNDCIVSKGTDCNNNYVDHILDIIGDGKRV